MDHVQLRLWKLLKLPGNQKTTDVFYWNTLKALVKANSSIFLLYQKRSSKEFLALTNFLLINKKSMCKWEQNCEIIWGWTDYVSERTQFYQGEKMWGGGAQIEQPIPPVLLWLGWCVKTLPTAKAPEVKETKGKGITIPAHDSKLFPSIRRWDCLM
jgi:hypothetical protein